MPSTYSNLKIQLMATGENNTTWGNVTNVNLGTAIEEAIIGSADVTFTSNNQTLTLTDTNSTQTARNMRLRCTGTTGGSTRNLVVPSIFKPYIVQNDCADAILVKTAAGSGITVPAGKTMWVYCNSVDVVDAVTHLSSLTLGTALPVAQGGTGATTASNARTQLGAAASGDNTDITSLEQDVTIAATGGAIGANTLGYRGLPQEAKTGAYTLALADAGKHISITTGGVVIPANSSVAFPVGTAVVIFNNSASNQTISITSDTLRWGGTTNTGSRTLSGYGIATAMKVASTVWVITGAGIS